MDLQEKRQLDVASQMARVKARARPWRSIFALVLALAGAVAVQGWGRPLSAGAYHTTGVIITYSGTAAFCLFGIAAALGLSGKARSALQPVIGSAHAAVVRYALVLASAIAILLITLSLADVSVGRLVLGGALTGVLLGIAAQQSLANVFAGLMLMFVRAFSVGDRVRIRSGALAGIIEGTVTEINVTYVRLDTGDGIVFLPNSQVLAAAVGLIAAPAGTPDDTPTGPGGSAPAPSVAQPGPGSGQDGSSVAQPGAGSGQPGALA